MMFRVGFAVCVCLLMVTYRGEAQAQSIDPRLMPAVQAGTFEVVAAKPADDPLTYEKPLPLELLPFQERNDKYYSIGTAFAIGDNRYVTAAHVLTPSTASLWGPPALRDVNGQVYLIDRIEKFSLHRDFAVFSVIGHPKSAVLKSNLHPDLNSVVFAVGNALGTGVVVRQGLYTSNTPEEQDGRWAMIRFSAAVSPGNSGGPLLDKEGKVLGVIVRKSPNENLNYALPIAEVLASPEHVAETDLRVNFRMGNIDANQIGTFSAQFTLPLSFAAFGETYQRLSGAFYDSQLSGLLDKEADRLFPNGAGAERILHGIAEQKMFPSLLTRNSDGVWTPAASPGTRMPLTENGYVQFGQAGGVLMFHWRKPDTVSATDASESPDLLINDLLKTGFLKRIVATEQIKITALGSPIERSVHTDRWQRQWQVRVWPLPYASMLLVRTLSRFPTAPPSWSDSSPAATNTFTGWNSGK